MDSIQPSHPPVLHLFTTPISPQITPDSPRADSNHDHSGSESASTSKRDTRATSTAESNTSSLNTHLDRAERKPVMNALASHSSSREQTPQVQDSKTASELPVPVSPRRLRRPKGAIPGGPLPKLSKKTKLFEISKLNLLPEQLSKPLFVAIVQVLLVYGNEWQTAADLVDGIRHFNLATLSGPTPHGTVQGAISKALSLAGSLGTFEPFEKYKTSHAAFYRVAARAMDPSSRYDNDSDATESDARTPARKEARKPVKVKSRLKTTLTNEKRKPKPSGIESSNRSKKRKPFSGWSSDSLCSGSDEDIQFLNGRQQLRVTAVSGRAKTVTSTTSKDSLPNGLRKLPKGYVYDTEINQAALMYLSVNPSQTGEYMQHLRGKSAKENDDYPDRRGDFEVDLVQEPNVFACEQQVGYSYPRLRNSGRERLPKGDCEDGYAIADLTHNGTFLGRLFCITDGHGGRACSSFVIATIPGAMQVILGKYKPTDLSQPYVQEVIRGQITEAVRLIDKEYLEYKKQQYLLYKSKKLPKDPGSDGTTLIVNIFIDKWIICLNLGDSRSVLGSRDPRGRWTVEFHSEDHTPSLERLAQTIYANGGEFVTHDDKVIRFDPTLNNDKKHRQSLREARIRVKDGESNMYGIPYRTTNGHCASVNLGACIGDVLYKLDPVNPILSCKPDITFIDISTIQEGFLLMATDGLWDYVKAGGRKHDPNAAVCQFVGDKIDRGWNEQRIVSFLSDREGEAGLYSDSIQEYDDFTAIVVRFSKKQLQEQDKRRKEQEQRQLLIERSRLEEQQRLLMQQQRMKVREIEKLQQMQHRMRYEQELLNRKTEGNEEDETESDTSTKGPSVDDRAGSRSGAGSFSVCERVVGSKKTSAVVKSATQSDAHPDDKVDHSVTMSVKTDVKASINEEEIDIGDES
ncbi:hypothetical protein BGX28_009946 [Mortierella sp. GBA30]|nr:hypothetical protein BGX28_009946 [Mortierella sp. GBA30]